MGTTDFGSGMAIGAVLALLIAGCIGYYFWYRGRRELVLAERAAEARIADLRKERAADKETNRQLRHELATSSPQRLIESATEAEMNRDEVAQQLAESQQDVAHLNAKLDDRERKLRLYREALGEIREALEAQTRAVPAGFGVLNEGGEADAAVS